MGYKRAVEVAHYNDKPDKQACVVPYQNKRLKALI